MCDTTHVGELPHTGHSDAITGNALHPCAMSKILRTGASVEFMGIFVSDRKNKKQLKKK